MTDFIIHFLICNICISGMIGMLFVLRRFCSSCLTSRTQYLLWFLPLCLMAVPFLPVRAGQVYAPLSWAAAFLRRDSLIHNAVHPAVSAPSSETASDWMNNFTVSVSGKTPSFIWTILFVVWIIGMLAVSLLVFRSSYRLHQIKKSALPLQNREVQKLYKSCLEEMHITKNIPISSTAFLTSPVITGLFRPHIYLPIRLITDFQLEKIRYMLLHELQHYRHKDNLSNYLLLPAGIIYWFNPLVRYMTGAMRNDREIACDSAVMNMLDKDSYQDYGYTLIRFAEKTSLSPYPFSSGLGGTIKQLERRIQNIAGYRKPSPAKTFGSAAFFIAAAVLFVGIAPALVSNASAEDRYQWKTPGNKITAMDLSSYFEEYEGSFVLYDLNQDQWSIYNREYALMRTAPDSTYKIYDALFALEETVITPESSLLTWNRQDYPFEAWEQDQTLKTAMSGSVNWYFQSLDQELGKRTIQNYLREIHYGNERMSEDLSSYWMESVLKISPVEQINLLKDFYQNTFHFTPGNIQAVKDSIRLSSSSEGTLYGKTGTGRVDGRDVNGWFIGFVETQGNTCFFALNIQAENNASGNTAANMTLSILSALHLWA